MLLTVGVTIVDDAVPLVLLRMASLVAALLAGRLRLAHPIPVVTRSKHLDAEERAPVLGAVGWERVGTPLTPGLSCDLHADG